MNNPGYNSGNQMYQGRNMILSSNPAVNVLKTVGSSGKFLVFAILVTADALLTVCAAFIGPSPLESISANSEYPLDLYLYRGFDIVLLYQIVLSVFLAIGIWMTYMTCKTTKSGGISTKELVMLKVTSIACCVSKIIVSTLLSFLAVDFLKAVYMDNFYDDSTYGGFNVFIYGPWLIVLFFLILGIILSFLGGYIAYYILLAKNINKIKATAETGAPDNRISSFVIAWSWVAAILGFLSGIIMLFISPLLGLEILVNSAAYMLLAIILSNYKAQMSALMSSYNVTSYTQPQANPVGVYTPPFQQPSYRHPMQQPNYQQPVQQPSYQQPIHQPSYRQPMQQPNYQQPVQQPSYQQPIHQPSYRQPMQQPNYQQPTQTDRPESDDKGGGSDTQ